MSVLSRPQRDWDEFLEKASGSRGRSSAKKLLWFLIPAAIFVVALACYKYLSG